MQNKTQAGDENVCNIPPNAARQYIADMLGELCKVADETGQKDLLSLLKVTSQAVRVIAKAG